MDAFLYIYSNITALVNDIPLEFFQSFKRLAARPPTLPLPFCINNGSSKKSHFKGGGVCSLVVLR